MIIKSTVSLAVGLLLTLSAATAAELTPSVAGHSIIDAAISTGSTPMAETSLEQITGRFGFSIRSNRTGFIYAKFDDVPGEVIASDLSHPFWGSHGRGVTFCVDLSKC